MSGKLLENLEGEQENWYDLAIKVFTTFLGVYEMYRRRSSACLVSNTVTLLRSMLNVDIVDEFFAILSDVCNNEIINIESKERYLQNFVNPLVAEAESMQLEENCFVIVIASPTAPTVQKKRKLATRNNAFDKNAILVAVKEALEAYSKSHVGQLPSLTRAANINTADSCASSSSVLPIQSTFGPVDVGSFIKFVGLEYPETMPAIAANVVIDARVARYDTIASELLHYRLIEHLRSGLNISEFYSHQVNGLNALLVEKKNLVVTTSTSSGKSLIYSLPIIDSLIRDPLSSTAMLIFPTKALARDQLLSLTKMLPDECGFSEVTASCFDGDIAPSSRDSIREHCPIILTNPDMLHVSILSNHQKWSRFFSNLKYVVIDEAHYYRAAFGIHFACVLRRLRRVLFKYGASPLFILCSATVINPIEMAVNLTGIVESSFEIIINDCSPLAAKDIVLFNPLNISPSGKTFKSSCPYKTSVILMKLLVCHNIRTIVFVRARQLGESLFDQLLEVLPYTLHSNVACYRAGYSATERQDLEQKIKRGDLNLIISTNALELGIDIGLLQCSMHIGYPGSISSFQQQSGRAGRYSSDSDSEKRSLSIYIGLSSPLDQYFMSHSQDFFSRQNERIIINPKNEEILSQHLIYSASEEPFDLDLELRSEPEANRECTLRKCSIWFGDISKLVLKALIKSKKLFAVRDPRNLDVYHALIMSDMRPTDKTADIRSVDGRRVSVIDTLSFEVIETLDYPCALLELHEGAVYLHRGRTYISTAFKADSNLVYVKPVPRLSYFTEVCEHSSVGIEGVVSTQLIDFTYKDNDTEVIALRRGYVAVTRSVYGYSRVDKKSGSIIDKGEVDQPAYEYKTMAVWSEIPISVQQGYLASKTRSDMSKKKKTDGDQSLSSKDEYDRGALHAIEHVMCSLVPALLMCDSRDMSCQHTRRTGDVNRFYLLLFESTKLGLGLTEKLQDKWFELLRMSYDLVRKCPCILGCPSCIYCSTCGESNRGLDKAGAQFILSALSATSQRC